MPLFALSLVLAAALLHAFWNLLAKNAHDSSAFIWWGVTVGSIWNAAWVLTQGPLVLPREIWLTFGLSMLAEIAYIVAISRGYAGGELSQVYPIARGSPPLLIAAWSAVFLAERLPAVGYVGIALLMVGVYLASLPSWGDLFKPLHAVSHRPAQWGLAAATCVSLYTVLDKLNVNTLDQLKVAFNIPIVYNAWVYLGIAVAYAPVAWSPANRVRTFAEWRTNWRWILVGSFATVGSYMLALTGMALTSASYVGAVRATSVVIGALFGWLLLKERLGAVRVIAAMIMVLGLLLVALA